MASIQDPVLKVSGAETAVLCRQLRSHRSAWAVSWESGALALTATLTPTFGRSGLRCAPLSILKSSPVLPGTPLSQGALQGCFCRTGSP